MRPNTGNRWTLTAVCWMVGLLFLYAGMSKLLVLPDPTTRNTTTQTHWLRSPDDFARAIENYRMLPVNFSRLLAVTLPWIEIAAAVALLTRRFRYEAALVLGGLCVVFLIALLRALISGLDISCGCFSPTPGSHNIGWMNLVLDVALLTMTVWIAASLESQRRESSATGRSS